MNLILLQGRYTICRLPALAPLPSFYLQSEAKEPFTSVTRTADELSIVCRESILPTTVQEDMKCEIGWSCLKVVGPLDFSLTGVLSALAQPLAVAKISIFAISTYDTDYLMVKEKDVQTAIKVLEGGKNNVVRE